MKTLILFYTYTGHTGTLARELAENQSADIVEIKDKKRPGAFKVYTAGCFAALRMKGWPIQPLAAELATYDRIVILSPVWAGHPAPVVNTVLELLPPGKDVEMLMVSTSGGSAAREKVQQKIAAHESRMLKYTDVKS